ncbi:MAG: hypothetical protein A2175_02190 [Candidatus Nealsonbacteria bacterium RBG_13_42_11]|uniref:DUF1614 domain-containing protein n=1 Tax=Candidatus Nealsonbacteria bacterium RBG_13_42_11 TaxID=1801663 RepID=A0A1G2E0Z4_9BACT|nr:MAG: hypothetical protein A2175_02190 [Candidatus Nealsonbacteria bacterium RBG_13_42_11]
MLFIPIAFILFIAFVLFLPLLFVLGYFQVITWGFEKLGISPEITLFLFLAILIGSAINIPLGKKRIIYVEESRFFGFWKTPKLKAQGLAINLGGAVIPILISFYFLFLVWREGFNLKPVLIATILMILASKILAKVVPAQGVSLPVLAPPIFAAIFSLILSPGFPAPCAFIAGTLGVLIGADILNLKKVQRYGGFLSIGGAGVFDGIFLVGIVAALLAGF